MGSLGPSNGSPNGVIRMYVHELRKVKKKVKNRVFIFGDFTVHCMKYCTSRNF